MSVSVLDQLRKQHDAPPTPEEVVASARRPVVGNYARISDAYEGKATGVTEDGVKRQLAKNELIAQARSWDLFEKQYIDNSVSAFKANVTRDAFEELLDDLASGVIDGIVCYNLDRFCRQVSDLERAIYIYDEARRQGRELVFATAEGDLNLASDDGLTLARVMVAFANKASRDTARRVTLKHQESRDAGRQVGGFRPFGWDWKRDTFTGIDGMEAVGRRYHVINEPEAEVIRQAAKGLVDGTITWMGVVRLWNDSGLLSPKGREWQPQTVKSVLRSPRMAGWLVHKGRIAIHSRTGKLVRAQAPAILTDEEYEALLVATEGRRGFTSASGRIKYMLSGIARCGECGARLQGNRRTDVHFYYACRVGNGPSRDGRNACGKVTVSGVELDRLIVDLVLPRIVEETGGIEIEREKPHVEEILSLRTEKDRLLAAYRTGHATSETVFPQVTKMEKKIERLRGRQAEWLRTQRVTKSAAITPDTWVDLDVAVRRLHIARHLEAVYVGRATKRGNQFDPSRVQPPVWRETAANAGLLHAVVQ